jgi:hypothetical protein
MMIQRIHTPEHVLEILAEDGDVAVILYYGYTPKKECDHPDGVILLNLSEAEQFSNAIVEAIERTRAAA